MEDRAVGLQKITVAAEALQLAPRNNSRLVIGEHGQVTGIIALRALLDDITIKMEFEPQARTACNAKNV